MCDFCGCPAIEPFATLTEEHATLDLLARLFAEGGHALDLEALRVTWEDHRAAQAAVRSLAGSLGLDQVVEAEADGARLDALLGEPTPDGKALCGAARGHIDGWEFGVFPQIVLAADADELEEAARVAATARAG